MPDVSHYAFPRIVSAMSQRTVLLVLMCEMSAATPGAPLISYSASSLTRGFSLRRRESGWPMPPAAPRTATLEAYNIVVLVNGLHREVFAVV